MYGIHELSIAKAAIAWTTVAGLLWHSLSLVRSFKANRRSWAIQREGHGEVQEVVIKMDGGWGKEDKAEKPGRKRDRIVRFLS